MRSAGAETSEANGIQSFAPEGRDVIQLTRLNSQAFALNTDLIERIEETPDTVLTLIDGTRYVVQEPVEDVIERVISFRARVVERATEDHVAELHVISDHRPSESDAERIGEDTGADGAGEDTDAHGIGEDREI